MSDSAIDAQRHRTVELLRFLAWLEDDPLHLDWAAGLESREREFDPSDLEALRHYCHDVLGELQAAVAQDEPLPQARHLVEEDDR